MKNQFQKLIAFPLVCLIFVSMTVHSQPTRTGTNLNSKAISSDMLVLNAPDEVERMRQLLIDGKKNDALIAAENYLIEVDRVSLPHETKRKYYAWNAYCAVLTSHRRIEDAIQACSNAMVLEPDKWSAVNNRGTAKLVGGMLQEALADYQTALSLVDEGNLSVQETIQHNIILIQERRGNLN